MIKCILVGDEPNKGAKSRTPFIHARCAKRLQEWIDYLVGDDDYIIVNQCDYEDSELAWLYFTYDEAQVVALGNKAYDRTKFLDSFKLPHPSGLNRQLNDKAKLFLKLRECRRFLGT